MCTERKIGCDLKTYVSVLSGGVVGLSGGVVGRRGVSRGVVGGRGVRGGDVAWKVAGTGQGGDRQGGQHGNNNLTQRTRQVEEEETLRRSEGKHECESAT